MATEFTQRFGEGDVRPGVNVTGASATISKGMAVKVGLTPTVKNEVLKAAAATDIPYGVAMADILTTKEGDIQIRGTAICLAGALTAAGVNVTSDGTARFVAAGNNEKVWGVSITAAGAAGEYMEIELAGPGGGSPTHA